MKKFVIVLCVCFFSGSAMALECFRPIERIFTGYTVSTSKIHIDHGDGYAASVVRLRYVNNDEKIVDRLLTVILTAHMTGKGDKGIWFRYASGVDGSEPSCKSTGVMQAVEAVWLD